MEIKMRKAKVSDLLAVQTVVRSLRKPQVPWVDLHIRSDIASRIAAGKYYVALVDNEIVGAVSLSECTRRRVEIEALAVKSSYRGRGIGRRLICFAKSFTRRNDASRIVVTSPGVYGAGLFYQNMGFRIQETWRYRGLTWHEYVSSV
jgi:N-acetylglutamate synthase-like GNAT family acetyltransferase